MFEKFIEFFSINNPVGINRPLIVMASVTQWFFLLSSVTFLGLLIWSIILYVREKKLDTAKPRFLPRVLGFSSALILTVIGLALSLVYLS